MEKISSWSKYCWEVGGGSCSIKQVVSHMEDLSTGAEGEAVRQSNIWRTSCKKKDGPEQPPKAVCASFVGRTPRRPFGRWGVSQGRVAEKEDGEKQVRKARPWMLAFLVYTETGRGQVIEWTLVLGASRVETWGSDLDFVSLSTTKLIQLEQGLFQSYCPQGWIRSFLSLLSVLGSYAFRQSFPTCGLSSQKMFPSPRISRLCSHPTYNRQTSLKASAFLESWVPFE